MKLFTNASLIGPEGILQDWYLLEKDGRIQDMGPRSRQPEGLDAQIIDCGGQYLSPGFIDIHCHGGGGYGFLDGTPQAIVGAARLHLAHGTTTLYPTTSTCSDENLFRFFDALRDVKPSGAALPHLPGVHLEGPYLSPNQAGAMNPGHLRVPTPEHYEEVLARSSGVVARWSVAPELPGALEMGRRLSRQGIVMSIGHSDAEYSLVCDAVENGYRLVTHLYSATSSIIRKEGYRILGVTESAYLLDELMVEIIADGIHLPPELLRLILRCKDHESICLITDGIRAAGDPQESSFFINPHDGRKVLIEGGIAKVPDRSCFAGSIATADRLIRVMTGQAGLSLAKAVRMLTAIPARMMGIEKKTGALQPGLAADLLLFNEDIQMQRVYVAGEEIQFN